MNGPWLDFAVNKSAIKDILGEIVKFEYGPEY